MMSCNIIHSYIQIENGYFNHFIDSLSANVIATLTALLITIVVFIILQILFPMKSPIID